MIIRGVFSMSIVNRLKHLFKGENEKKDILLKKTSKL